MPFVSLHVTSRRSGLDALERYTEAHREAFLRSVRESFPDAELLILRTCNRFELYLALPEEDVNLARRWLASQSRVKGQRILSGRESVVQLFSVAAGLDSELVGEDEVLGQVRGALLEARKAGDARGAIGPLFERAIHTGRRVRNETGISKGVRSLSRLAIEEARRRVPDLDRAEIGILGTGGMGKKILTRLLAEGSTHVHVASRIDARRKELAAEWPVPILTPERLLARLSTLNLLFCAAETERPYTILSKGRPRDRPLVIVDLGMPRNVTLSAGRAGIHRIDLKDLQRTSRALSRQKKGMLPKAKAIVDQEADLFLKLCEEQAVADFAETLLTRAYALAQEERQRALSRIGTAQDPGEVLENYGRSIVKKLLLPSLSRLRALPIEERAQVLKAASTLFAPSELQEVELSGREVTESRIPSASSRRAGMFPAGSPVDP